MCVPVSSIWSYIPNSSITDKCAPLSPKFHRLTAENRLLLSRVVVETNYYQLLFGPDTVTLAGDILYPEGGQTAAPYS